jgi:hypothetical protein
LLNVHDNTTTFNNLPNYFTHNTSLGDAFEYKWNLNGMMVNPPYLEPMLGHASAWLLLSIQSSQAKAMAIYIIPDRGATRYDKALRSSHYTKVHFILTGNVCLFDTPYHNLTNKTINTPTPNSIHIYIIANYPIAKNKKQKLLNHLLQYANTV